MLPLPCSPCCSPWSCRPTVALDISRSPRAEEQLSGQGGPWLLALGMPDGETPESIDSRFDCVGSCNGQRGRPGLGGRVRGGSCAQPECTASLPRRHRSAV